MGEYTEHDIGYVRGQIEGFILGVMRHSASVGCIDQADWEDLYGSRIIYESVPAYPSVEARRQNEGVVVLADWIDETEDKYLKDSVSLPRDRPGTLVFEDGTVVTRLNGDSVMFSLDEDDTNLVESWDRLLLDVIRDAYDYDEREKKEGYLKI